MPIVADAAVRVAADLKPYNKDMQGAGRQADTLGAKMKSALSPKNLLIGAGAFAAGFASVKVMGFLNDSIEAASDLNEVVSKTGEIMGQEALPGLEKWAETASRAFGQSKRQALEGAANFAIFGKSAGLAGDELAGFSTEMVELASDMASFHNASPEEAITAIGAALRGESEPIRRFGVLLDDASLRAEAFKQGLIETTSQALTPQQRVLAAHALILQQTADAQGDFARTSDGLANSQRTLAARMEDAQAQLGEKLLPIMLAFVQFLTDHAVPAIGVFADALGEIGDGISKVVAVRDVISAPMRAFRDLLREEGEEALRLKEIHNMTSDERLAKSTAHWAAMQGVYSTATEGIANLTAAHAEEQSREWERIASTPTEAMRDEYNAIRNAAYQSMVEYAKGVMEGQNEPQVAFDAAMQLVEDEMTKAEEIANLKGKLMTLEHALGVASAEGKVATVNAINATISLITDRLDLLTDGAYSYGYNIPYEIAKGMNAGAGLLVDPANTLATKISSRVAIESEPKDHTSPLYGITKWGGNIVKTIAEGIYGELGMGSSAAAALASSLVPGFGTPALGAAGAGVAGAPGPTTIFQLHVSGKEPEIGTKQDILDAWESMASFTDRRAT